ncbi:MAG: toxin-antitoxin system YwqK family antitoxin [Bacteroidetes bacterium]|nr:toxin-antitoxin system YwqK family antitoxin [Bacteroidota bacterium]
MMNRLVLLFLLLGINFFAFGQAGINFTDASGLRQGAWVKSDKEGHKIYEGQFKNSVPYGEFRYYYPGGKIKTVSEFEEEGKTVKTVSYSENGRKIAEGKYWNEKKDSIWKYYSDYDGVLLSEENYSSGLRNGTSKTFYPNGNIAEQVHYSEGRKEGEWIQYFEDGKLKFKGSYSNDEKDGPFTAYYPGGKINFSGAYKAGHMDGTWSFYEENGEVMRSEKYSGGARIIDKKQ